MNNKLIARTENVSRAFNVSGNTIYAIRQVSIDVPEKSFIILRGRSGSGKTTLMNIIGALDRADSGRVFYGDIEIGMLSEHQRTLIRRKEYGFVFQSVALVSFMTAYENVELCLKVSGCEVNSIKKRVEECMDLVGLSKRMHHMAYELSGGEQQRVGIARAIAHKPSVIFADEPTAELDSRMGLQIVKLFKDLVEKENVTMFMTSHDPAIMEVADYVYVLEDGSIIN